MSQGNSNRETRNLGLIKAIQVGVNPPLNTKIIWYDDNPGQKIHKYYEVSQSSWIPLAGVITGPINGIYTYIGYASDCDGSDFSLSLDDEVHTHLALVTSSSPIASPNESLFAGRYIPMCLNSNNDQIFTYIRYADDTDGTNLSDSPVYEVPCGSCEWLDGFSIKSADSGWSISPITDGVRVSFSGAAALEGIDILLNQGGDPVPSFANKYVTISQDNNFTGAGEGILDIVTDSFTNSGYQYEPSVGSQDFQQVFNGSFLAVRASALNSAEFSGYIDIKIGNLECETTPTGPCYECRKFMAIVTSTTPINPVDASTFQGHWIPIGGCQDNSSGGYNISNIYQQLANMASAVKEREDATDAEIQSINNTISALANLVDSNATTQQKSIDDNKTAQEDGDSLLQGQIDTLSNELNIEKSKVVALQDFISDSNAIMAVISSAIDDKITAYDATIQPTLTDLDQRVSDNAGDISNLQNP